MAQDSPSDQQWLPPVPPGAGHGGSSPATPSEDVSGAEPLTARSKDFAPASAREAKPVFVQPAKGTRPKSSLDTAATVLGVIGMGLLVITLGLGALLALPFSLAAWTCASIARRQTPDSAGQRSLGWRLGVTGVALGLGAAIIWTALEASGFGALEWLEGIQRDLEEQQRQLESPPERITRV